MGALVRRGRSLLRLVHKEWRDTRRHWLLLALVIPVALDLVQRVFPEVFGHAAGFGGWLVPVVAALAAYVLITEAFSRDEHNGFGDTLATLPVPRLRLLLAKGLHVVLALAALAAWVTLVELGRRAVSEAVVEPHRLVPDPFASWFLAWSLLLCVALTVVFRQALGAILGGILLSFGGYALVQMVAEKKLLGGVATVLLRTGPDDLMILLAAVLIAVTLATYRPGTRGTSLPGRMLVATGVSLGLLVPAAARTAQGIERAEWRGTVRYLGHGMPSLGGRFLVVHEQVGDVGWITWEDEGRLRHRAGVLDTWSHEVRYFPEGLWPDSAASHPLGPAWDPDEGILLEDYSAGSDREGSHWLWDPVSGELEGPVPPLEVERIAYQSSGTRWARLFPDHSARGSSSGTRRLDTDSRLDLDREFPIEALVAPTNEVGVVLVLEDGRIDRLDLVRDERRAVGPCLLCPDRMEVSPDGRWVLLSLPQAGEAVLLRAEDASEFARVPCARVEWSRVPGRVVEVAGELTLPGDGPGDGASETRALWLTEDGRLHSCPSPRGSRQWLDDDRMLLFERNDRWVIRTWNRHDGAVVTLRDLQEVHPVR